MKNLTLKNLFLVFTALSVISPAFTQTKEVLHPEFTLMDKGGNITHDPMKMSSERSCMQCHNVKYINSHNSHYKENFKPDCVVCHFKGSEVPGDPREISSLIRTPDVANCAYCHGIASDCLQPLTAPKDFARVTDYYAGGKNYGMTQHTGEIFSPQEISFSYLNIKNKNSLNYTWDVHAKRSLVCADCHFSPNGPRSPDEEDPDLRHLIRDPRRIKPIKKQLQWPDHRLAKTGCITCHDPYAAHDHLPYKKRHIKSLSCQSCHSPIQYGPAFRSVDSTVMNEKGEPRIEFRHGADNYTAGFDINTTYLTGYTPVLIPDKNAVISPFNIVTWWDWVDNSTNKKVRSDIMSKVFLLGNKFRSEIIEKFDANGDRKLDEKELRIDSEIKKIFIKAKLMEAGIKYPVIKASIETYKVSHGMVHEKEAVRECTECHSDNSRIGRDVLLAEFIPAGIMPALNGGSNVLPECEIKAGADGRLSLKISRDQKYKYVLGRDRMKWIDTVGLILFMLCMMAVAAHAVLRFISSKMPGREIKTRKVLMYSFYERLWHWTMATGIGILIITGLEIHYGGSFVLAGLENATIIHKVIAFIFILNAFLSLFYHIATGEIKKFFGVSRLFLKEATSQFFYYTLGIFVGSSHPVPKTEERKFNPLQQIIYAAILNILLPFQIITGILMWFSGNWPELTGIKGLTLIAPLHNLGTWIIAAFVITHVYLTTTGQTLFSNIKAMITGIDELEIENGGQPAEIPKYTFKDIIRKARQSIFTKTEG